MNGLKTGILLAAMTALLLVIGNLLRGQAGVILFLIIAAVMNFGTFWFSDQFALRMSGAREVTREEEPALFAMVEEVAHLAAMPMPRVYVIDQAAPNAFATGRSPNNAAVAVTAGIRHLLNERELRAVMGHEMAHVKNRDTLTSSMVATIAGAISFISFAAMWFGGRNGLAALAVAILAPVAAGIIQFAISRTREYAADETGAEIVRDPEGLASALAKLHQGVAHNPMEPTPMQESVASLYIVNPFSGDGVASWFSTHPPVENRIERLLNIAHGRGR